MESPLVITPYDTFETLVYAMSSNEDVPRDMIIISDSDTSSPSFLNAEEIIRQNYEKVSLSEIDIFLRSKTNKHWRKKIIDSVIFFVGQKLEKLGTSYDELKKFTKSKHAKIALDLIDTINEFYAKTRFRKSLTMAKLAKSYTKIVELRNLELSRVDASVVEMNRVFEKYNQAMENPPLKTSELITVQQNLRISIIDSATGIMPVPESSFAIFDVLKCTRQIPHITCRDANGNFFQKNYDILPYEKEIPYNAFLDIKTQGLRKSTIVFSYIGTRGVYIFTWYVDFGYIEVLELPGNIKDSVLANLKIFLNNYSIDSVVTSKNHYELRLYPIERRKFFLKEYILLHRLIREPEIFQYYVNETTSAYPYKKAEELNFRYNPRWKLSSLTMKDEVEFQMSLGSTAGETNCIVLSILSETEIGIYRLLSTLIPSICIHYTEDLIGKSAYDVIYDKIPDIVSKFKKIRTKEKQQLFDEFPEVFTYNYLYGGKDKDKVQKRDLVRVTVDKTLAKEWKNEIIERNEISIPRPVEKFYDTEGNFMFWYTSIKDDTPYLRLVENTRDENTKYPFVPASSTAEGYSTKEKTDANVSKPISSLLALDVTTSGARRIGLLPSSFDDILPGYLRMGMAKGPNSFLECLLYATGKSTKKKNILKVRKEIAETILPDRLRQQFYDFSNEDITKKLSEVNFHLDPYLFVAALEEYFNLDIYLFAPTTKFNLTTVKLMTPRNYSFYCRNPNMKKCVLIFYNPGVDSDRLPYNHCELIYKESEGEEVTIHPLKKSEELREIALVTSNSFLCTDKGIFGTRFLTLDVESLLKGKKMLFQYIDGYGKCRSITCQDPKTEKLYSVVFAATEPRNLPAFTDVLSSQYLDVLDAFPGRVLGKSDDGIWIEIKGEILNTILYFRIEDAIPEEILYLGVDPIIVKETDGQDAILASAQKEKDFVIITELLYWLLDIYAFENSQYGKANYINFLEDRVTYEKKKVDENEYYGVLEVKQTLPEVADFREAFQFASKVFPISKGKRIVLHNKNFYVKISYLLSKHQRSIKLISSVKSERIIPNFYRSIYDFQSHEQNTIRTENVDVRSLRKLGTRVDVLSEVIYDENRKEPILYTQNDSLYCIQNTILEDFGSAFRVSETWVDESKNIGYGVASIDIPLNELDFILFKLELGMIKPVFASPKAVETSPLILDYGNKKYAALLKI